MRKKSVQYNIIAIDYARDTHGRFLVLPRIMKSTVKYTTKIAGNVRLWKET